MQRGNSSVDSSKGDHKSLESKENKTSLVGFLKTFFSFMATGFIKFIKQRTIPILVVLTWLLILGALAMEVAVTHDYVDGFWALRLFGPFLSNFYDLAIWTRQHWIITAVISILFIGLLAFWCRSTMYQKTKEMRLLRQFLRICYCLPVIFLLIIHGVYVGVNLALENKDGLEAFENRAQELGQFSNDNLPRFEVLAQKIKHQPEFFADKNLAERADVYQEISNFIKLQNGPLTLDQHLLRNYLNYAPETLDELLAGQGGVRWNLLSPFSSAYHMFGEDGEFNVKFLSEDGHLEAVYDKYGRLLTAENDPVNMATYNFDGGGSHSNFDVKPYYVWGNTGTKPNFSSTDIIDNLERFFSNKEARERYQEIFDAMSDMKSNEGGK